jgi:hypothetical protein
MCHIYFSHLFSTDDELESTLKVSGGELSVLHLLQEEERQLEAELKWKREERLKVIETLKILNRTITRLDRDLKTVQSKKRNTSARLGYM